MEDSEVKGAILSLESEVAFLKGQKISDDWIKELCRQYNTLEARLAKLESDYYRLRKEVDDAKVKGSSSVLG